MASSRVQSPPVRYQPADKTGYCNRIWSRWFLDLFTALGGSLNLGASYLTITTPLTIPGTPYPNYIPIPANATLIQVTVANDRQMSGAPEQVNILNAFGSIISTLTIEGSASAGHVTTINLQAGTGLGNDFTLGQVVGIAPLGTSSSFCLGTFVLTFIY